MKNKLNKIVVNKEIMILSAEASIKDPLPSVKFKKIRELVFFSFEIFHAELVDLLNTLNYKKTKGVIVVLPLTISAHQATPSSIINKIPIGLLYCRKKNEIHQLIHSLKYFDRFDKKEFVVLAMWKNFYLNLGNEIYQTLIKGFSKKGFVVNKWFADEVSRDELVCLLSERKIGLLIYLGHGRSRGWSGFRGLRWHHLKSKKIDENPIGIIISMTCDNLKFDRNKIPFGVKWVLENRASAFFGATDSVKIIPMKKICNLLASLFSKGKVDTIGKLIVSLNEELSKTQDAEIKNCWSKFRLIGNPLIQI